jgi:hypothetical protein
LASSTFKSTTCSPAFPNKSAACSAIALANGLNTNQVFKWHRMALAGEQGSSAAKQELLHPAAHCPEPAATPQDHKCRTKESPHAGLY